MAEQDRDKRMEMFTTLTTTPHRKLDLVHPIHSAIRSEDPLFYVRLAAWYADHGDIRDHKEAFVVNLCLSAFPGHRDVGLALLRDLPPYQVGRVVDFVEGRKTTKKVKEKGAAKDAPPKEVTESFGLFKSLPRCVKTEVARYLREREANDEMFDGCVLSARKAMKRLYAKMHVKPSERAQKILFDDAPPEGSRVAALRDLTKANTPADQARAIVQHKIPYRVAVNVVTQMTPSVLLALVEVMSPQELMNSLAMLKRRGGLDHPDVKAVVDAKLETMKKAKGVAALKVTEAIKAAGLEGGETAKKLEAAADAQLKTKGRVTRATTIFVDKSSSMELSVEIGKRLAALVSQACDAELSVYAFDTMSYPITPGTPLGGSSLTLADWERAFVGVTANGSTSCGAPFAHLVRQRKVVEQIVVISDGGDNTPPLFHTGYRAYCQQMGLTTPPHVVYVRVPVAQAYRGHPGSQEMLSANLRAAGIAFDVWDFSGADYYSLPGVLPLLTKAGRLELLAEIMDYPLPTRRPALVSGDSQQPARGKEAKGVDKRKRATRKKEAKS